ncbi:MAG: DUF4440 domain-containing protein [Patescibacteria group bacterium]|nr:DUF4440 domain-containing protein [Patescibacteria group bacterium]MDE1944586.1 DUF4440 domain-containing protein [Patescibacteria group bacterium]MDE1945285.1 DUF4440 domain-containing protein [Patescibacteria group bacterium]MDE2057862.1 DUF4440 domain-containing protein [Patescibacteria group bacterium]
MDEKAIRAAYAAFVRAWNNGDRVGAVAGIYADRVVMVPLDDFGTVWVSSEIQLAYQSRFPNVAAMGKLDITIEQVCRDPGGVYVLITSRSRLPDGRESRGRACNYLVERRGRPVIVHDEDRPP